MNNADVGSGPGLQDYHLIKSGVQPVIGKHTQNGICTPGVARLAFL
jgi:hypothetical protein